MAGNRETGAIPVNELAEVLLIALLALPAASAIAAGIPGAWWPETRRHWFALFACGVCGAGSAATVACSFWLRQPLTASISAGNWLDFPAGSAIPVPLDFSLKPASVLFVLAISVGGTAIARRIANRATAEGCSSRRTAALLAIVSLAIGSVLATSAVVRGCFLVIACAVIWSRIGHQSRVDADGPVARFFRGVSKMASGPGQLAKQLCRAAAQLGVDFCERILEEMETNNSRFYVAAALLSTVILAAAVAWR